MERSPSPLTPGSGFQGHIPPGGGAGLGLQAGSSPGLSPQAEQRGSGLEEEGSPQGSPGVTPPAAPWESPGGHFCPWSRPPAGRGRPFQEPGEGREHFRGDGTHFLIAGCHWEPRAYSCHRQPLRRWEVPCARPLSSGPCPQVLRAGSRWPLVHKRWAGPTPGGGQDGRHRPWMCPVPGCGSSCSISRGTSDMAPQGPGDREGRRARRGGEGIRRQVVKGPDPSALIRYLLGLSRKSRQVAVGLEAVAPWSQQCRRRGRI